jgi:hypothetical protein
MPKKFNYYHVDAGHFKVQIKLCFDNAEFQRVLIDHNITLKTAALEVGIAETHYVSDGREGIIVMVFDLDECDEGPAYLAGIVAHEATHCASRIFEHIGEEVDEIGEESRAYLTEHIVSQITQAIIVEKEKRARKTSRAVPKQKNKTAGGIELQVDINDQRSSGQDSDTEQPSALRGAKDDNGSGVGEAKNSVQGARRTRLSGGNYKKQVRCGDVN